MGLDPLAFQEWVIDDVADTINTPGGPWGTPDENGVVRLNAPQLGSLIAMHSHIYMELGFAIGKGEVGAAASLGNGWLGKLAAAGLSIEQACRALIAFANATPPGAPGTGDAREIAGRLALAEVRADDA